MCNLSAKKKIAYGLKELFEKIVSSGILCFDIKPGNTLISYFSVKKKEKEMVYPDSIELKLIDVDSDWCYNYSHMNKGPLGSLENQKNAHIYILLMIMGCFFSLHPPKNNFLLQTDIFAPLTDNKLLIKQMHEIWNTIAYNKTAWDSMAHYYFNKYFYNKGLGGHYDNTINISNGFISLLKIGCNIDSREILLAGRSRSEKRRRTNQHQPQQQQQQQQRGPSNVGMNIGGGIKKRKSKRKRRIRRKKQKTKRRRKKSRKSRKYRKVNKKK
jgi:hypothetical protein